MSGHPSEQLWILTLGGIPLRHIPCNDGDHHVQICFSCRSTRNTCPIWHCASAGDPRRCTIHSRRRQGRRHGVVSKQLAFREPQFAGAPADPGYTQRWGQWRQWMLERLLHRFRRMHGHPHQESLRVAREDVSGNLRPAFQPSRHVGCLPCIGASAPMGSPTYTVGPGCPTQSRPAAGTALAVRVPGARKRAMCRAEAPAPRKHLTRRAHLGRRAVVGERVVIEDRSQPFFAGG